ncbi:MAG: peroxiredoxin [Acidobacteria bacterium]|nr:peroxiredoxin [Acidobacteriota bacterium]
MLPDFDCAPDFELKGIDENGKETLFTLDSLLKENNLIVLYFYPKDNTPGCTMEACDFRDNISRIKNEALVVGISADSIESHKKFQEKYKLPFPLLSDPEKKVIKLYKSFGNKSLYGKIIQGIIRSTFIIGEGKKILKHWHKVSPKGHAQEVLETLKELKKVKM